MPEPEMTSTAGELQAPGAYPRVSQAIGLIVLALVLSTAFAIPVWILTRRHTDARSAAMLIVQTLSTVLVVRWGFRKTASPFQSVFPLQGFGSSLLVPMVLMMVGITILTAEVDYILESLWPMPRFFREMKGVAFKGSPWSVVLTLVVIAPVTEELLFRGLILRGFLRNYGRRRAIVLSAILFALVHVSPWQLVGVFAGGVVLGWWSIETGSLLPCFFGHALYNFLCLLVWVAFGRGALGDSAAWARLPPPWLGVVAVLGPLLFGTGVWLFRRWSSVPRPDAGRQFT
jgi:membrane protease YdiL (CAAX protease family)